MNKPITVFAQKTMLLALAVVLSVMALTRAFPAPASISEADFLSASNDKNALIAKTASPKIILAGGSGVALGMDSERIQKALGKPVVNMGLYAGLGLRVMLDQVKPYIQPGDTIYITPEYQLYFVETRRNDEAIATLIRVSFPATLGYLRPTTHFSALASMWNNQQKAFAQAIHPADKKNIPAANPIVEYTRAGFNPFGDYVAHLDKPGLGEQGILALKLSYQEHLTFDEDSIAALNEFASFAASRGAKAILDFPAIPENLYAKEPANKAILDELFTRLTRERNLILAGSPDKSLLPAAYFYDTIYHLNRAGHAANTDRVINQLLHTRP